MGYVTSVELFMDLKPQIYEVCSSTKASTTNLLHTTFMARMKSSAKVFW